MFSRQTLVLLAVTGITLFACAETGGDSTDSAGSEVNVSQPSTPAPKTKFGTADVCKKTTDFLACFNCCNGTTPQPPVSDTALTACLCRRMTEHCSPEVGKTQCKNTGNTPPSTSSPPPPGTAECDINAELDACEVEAKKACDADPNCAGANTCFFESNCARFVQ